MKRILILLLICILSISCQAKENPPSDHELSSDSNSNETTVSSNKEVGLTLTEAIDIALKEALKWNKKANLYFGISVDKDKTQTGMNGKRKNWNIQFGIPGETDWYLVSIRDGKVRKTKHLPDELDSMPKSSFISDAENFKYDTPELLKKGQKITNIYPGDTFAKGYNFGFKKDPKKDSPLVMVIGWDKARKNMIYLMFNGTTGELVKKIEREQYKN